MSLFVLGGCKYRNVPPPPLPPESTLPSAIPTPFDPQIVERTWQGLPNFQETSEYQRTYRLSYSQRDERYDEIDLVEQALHAWPQSDPFASGLRDFYHFCAENSIEGEKWIKHNPDSHVPNLAWARFALERAYVPLNKKLPAEAPPKALKRFQEQVELVKEYLKGEGLESCPSYHATLIELALLEGASREKIDELLKASDAVAPGYLPSYALAAIHRAPGWAGYQEGESWQEIAKRLPAPEGADPKLWEKARLALLEAHKWRQAANAISPAEPEWSELSASFDAAAELWPGSVTLLNLHAQKAVTEQDWATLSRVLARLGRFRSRENSDVFGYYALLPLEDPGQVVFDPLPGANLEVEIPTYLPWLFFRAEVGELFSRGCFPELEQMGQAALKGEVPEGSRFTGNQFLESLELDTLKDEKREHILELLEIWKTMYPDSVMPLICEAKMWNAHGWRARGTGYAYEVSSKDMATFKDSSQKALPIFEDVLKKVDNFELKVDAASCYLSSSTDLKRGFELLDEALAEKPLEDSVIWAYTLYLLQNWHGKPGDLKRLIARINELSETEVGAALVMRNVLRYYGSSAYETEVDWDTTRASFEKLIKRNPTSANRLQFALAAYWANDRATARRMYQEVGEEWAPEGEKNVGKDWKQVRKWATGSGPRPDIRQAAK